MYNCVSPSMHFLCFFFFILFHLFFPIPFCLFYLLLFYYYFGCPLVSSEREGKESGKKVQISKGIEVGRIWEELEDGKT